MGEEILAIDLGTTAIKVALFDRSGNILALSTQEYSLITPKPDFVEADADIYWESFKNGIADIKKKRELDQVTALGISAQGETLFFVDKEGRPLRNAIVWMDNRAKQEAAELEEKFTNELCYRITGQVSFQPCWPASKLLWVKKNEPEVFEKTFKFLLIEDYIIHKLTGRYVSEGSLLCSTTYWDINTKKYWKDMLGFLGITEDSLPEILESGEKVAKILPDIAKELDIGAQIMVCTGALDQAAGAVGVGNINEGMFSENIGAALAVCVPTKHIKLDPNRIMPVHYFAIKDMYMMHTFTTGGMTLRWFRDNFCQNEMIMAKQLSRDSYDLLAGEAEIITPGSEGLIVLPHLAGSLAPDINSKAKGVFHGFTLNHTKAHCIRAIMESIGYILKRNIESLQSMGIEIEEIRSLGGGSKSSLWNQIKTDITSKRLITMDVSEAACLGAAILAAKAVGIFGSVEEACEKAVSVKRAYIPEKENRSVYEKGYKKYIKIFSDLTQSFEL